MLRVMMFVAAACGCAALASAEPAAAPVTPSTQAGNPAGPTAPADPTMPTTSQPDPATGPSAATSAETTGNGTSSGSATGAYPSTSGSAASATTSADNTRLASLLPAGTTAQEACSGFQDTETCAVVLHASQNLNIPFADLKSRLASGKNLQQSIRDIKPDADAAAEEQRAIDQARTDAHPPQG